MTPIAIRRSLIPLAVAVACAGTSWAGGADVTYVDVSDSVVMARNSDGSNLTCIALDEGLAFVDAGLLTDTAAQFREAMERRFDRPTKYLFLTHGHLDHFFAMAAFHDVEVVAGLPEKPLFERQLAIEFDAAKTEAYTRIFPAFADAVESAAPFAPTIWVDGERTFGSGDSRLVFATTGGHTTGSSYVWLPAERVLIAGDLVQVDKHPYFGDPSNDLSRWIETLKRWHGMEPAAVCPGHGRQVDAEYLRLEWEFFEALIAALKKLKADGVSLRQAVGHPSLPAGYWPDDEPEPRWWKSCIAQCYASL